MINRLIVINVSVFVILNLIKVFTSFSEGGLAFYAGLLNNIAIPADLKTLVFKPWTLITHMFVHEGFFHILWNMLLLMWFGRIFGDFVGDRRVLSFYFLGGFAGAFLFVAGAQTGIWGYENAIGASAAVMAFIVGSAFLSPDYTMHLLFLGPVKLKYIALAMVFLDFISVNGHNSGGHLAHLGGAFLGMGYVQALRSGTDMTSGLNKFFDSILDWYDRSFGKKEEKEYVKSPKKAKMTVSYGRGTRQTDDSPVFDDDLSFQEKVDTILDKIKDQGYDQLSEEEKEFLFKASKK